MESYKNILANKFMRDTNYIIIKDTDDLEELERQFELFSTQLTTRQQRLSDDRSIEIWNMTNKEHYESLKLELMKQMDDKFGNTENIDNVFSYDPEEENIDNDDISNIFDDSSDDEFDDNFEFSDDENNITESVSEDSKIPIDNNKHIESEISNTEKDNLADQYEIDTNINIIGRIKGKNKEENLANLEKLFTDFNSQSEDHKKTSDDKCIEIYGMTNLDRYNKIKAEILKHPPEKTETIKVDANNITDISKEQTEQLEFVSQIYNNMKVINEEEQIKVNKHKRFNDTPYFTPSEMIDMGVHGNHNFYSKDADNDGLITNVKVPTWFASYKDMCMDHIFEDYRKDWIDTLDTLYSDFEDIKQSGDQEKILARKQSILDLGWNPEIKFNRKNRLKASERVSKILDETIPSDIFINLNDIPDEYVNDEVVEEQMTQKTHKPVLLIFTQGHTPVVSQGIKLFTGSSYSHASISFDPELNEVYSYNMRGENFGFIKENLSSFKDNVISVMAFFAPNNIVQSLKDKIQDFKDNDTTFDLRIFLNKILHIDKKVSKNEYHQVCSTFVDTVLKSGNINLVGDINIPDPGQLYTAAKNIPNKIIEIFNDIAIKYDGKKVKKKISSLFKTNIKSIEEASFINDEGQTVPKKCPECGSDVGIFFEGEPIYRCTNKECKKYFGVVKPPKHKSIKEQTSILNEVKQFPIEFDKDGNLIIYKARIGSLSFGDEIDDSVQLLESYRNQSNLEGIKYEIAKLWYINDCIEKKLKKRLTNDQYKELIDTRAICLNAFKFNLDFLMKSEKGFNFSDYYNSTPFSDNSIKITSNTLKYTMKAITSAI